jgi:hypothetical protein
LAKDRRHSSRFEAGKHHADKVRSQADGFRTRKIERFRDVGACRVHRRSLGELKSYAAGEKPGRFGRATWLRELIQWAEEQVTPLGVRLTGNFRQLNTSPTFLIRLETNSLALISIQRVMDGADRNKTVLLTCKLFLVIAHKAKSTLRSRAMNSEFTGAKFCACMKIVLFRKVSPS